MLAAGSEGESMTDLEIWGEADLQEGHGKAPGCPQDATEPERRPETGQNAPAPNQPHCRLCGKTGCLLHGAKGVEALFCDECWGPFIRSHWAARQENGPEALATALGYWARERGEW